MGIYEIREDGRIFNLIKGKELNYHIDNNGYVYVYLMNSNHKQVKKLVHQLVAEQFISNPHGYKIVKHKDGNLQNNHYINLEWVKLSNENLKNNKQTSSKKIKLIDKRNLREIEFNSSLEASLYLKSSIEECKDIDVFSIRSNIIQALNSGLNAYGYKWIYIQN